MQRRAHRSRTAAFLAAIPLALSSCDAGQDGPSQAGPPPASAGGPQPAGIPLEEMVIDTSLAPPDLNKLGLFLHGHGRYSKAIEAYDAAIAKSPDVGEYHRNRGESLYFLRRKEDAIQAFRKALELTPDDPVAHNNLIDTLGEQGRMEEAIQACLRAHELTPENVKPFNRRGQALYELKRYDEALEAFDMAALMAPEDVDILINRAQTLIALKLYDQALVDLDRVDVLDPKQYRAKDARNLITRTLAFGEEAVSGHDHGGSHEGHDH